MVCLTTHVNEVWRSTSEGIYHVIGGHAHARPIANHSNFAMQINKLYIDYVRNSLQPGHLSFIFHTLHLLLTEIGILVN